MTTNKSSNLFAYCGESISRFICRCRKIWCTVYQRYDTDNWFERAKGMEWKPERGIRHTMCFERTALYDAAHYPGMVYWDYNWCKQGGSSRMIEVSKREQFY